MKDKTIRKLETFVWPSCMHLLNGIELEILKYLLHFNYVIMTREWAVQGVSGLHYRGSRARNITSVKLHPT